MGKRFQKIRSLIKLLGFIEGVRFFLKLEYGLSPRVSVQFKQLKAPIFLRRGLSDFSVFEDIFLKHEYHFKHEKNPQIIVDAGANIGLAAIFFKIKFPQARIICLEPEPGNFNQLMENTQALEGVTCLQKGLWNKSCRLEIVDAGLGAWGFIVRETNETRPDTVEAVSLGDLRNQFHLDRLDLVKIDIEGSEKEVMEQNTAAWIPHTDTILIEFHDRFRPGTSYAFFKTMVQYNFSLSHVGENLICHLRHA
jgi:FkbM family methyltransferase